MRRICSVLIVIQMLYPSSSAQEVLRIGEQSEVSIEYSQYVTDYIENQSDCVALNSIIEVNGFVHSKDTYGYIDYVDTGGVRKRCLFEHMGGVIRISKKDYEGILMLEYTKKVCIAICLQSPKEGDWGGSWDMVMVKGYFDVDLLRTTRSTLLSPCFHFIITSIGTDIFKIQFCSWRVQTQYYSTTPIPVTSRQHKQLDRKESRIYKRAKKLHFERELW